MAISRRGWNQFDEETIFNVCVNSIKTTNYVATGSLSAPIDVHLIARRHPGTVLHMNMLPALIVRLDFPSITCSNW